MTDPQLTLYLMVKTETSQGCPLLSLLFNTELEALRIRQEIKRIQIRKEEV